MTRDETPPDHPFGAEHVRIYRETDGERGYIWKRGTTVLLLTTRGARTGLERTMPLIFREDAGRYVIVASNDGQAANPAWLTNIRAHPDDVSIQVKNERFAVTAAVAGPDERARLWPLMTEAFPDYEHYQASTDREFAVVLLTPR